MGHLTAFHWQAWVPKWTTNPHPARRLGHTIDASWYWNRHQADSGSPPLRKPSILQSRLFFQAFHVTEVSTILNSIRRIRSDDDEDVASAIIKNWNFIDSQDLKYDQGANCLQAFWRVLSANVAGVQSHWPEHCSSMEEVSTSQVSLAALQNTCSRSRDHPQFYYVLRDANLGRRLFLAKDRRMCPGTNNVQQGDQIAILQGARMPFVLRKLINDDPPLSVPLYGIVGESYLDGVTYGELFEGDAGIGSGWERIVLT